MTEWCQPNGIISVVQGLKKELSSVVNCGLYSMGIIV